MQTISPASRSVAAMMKTRVEGLKDWISENAPECCTEQRHLEKGTSERAYWHHGYLSALLDILRLMTPKN
jgi:hypothetical protein